MPSFIDTPILDSVVQGSNANARETIAGMGMEVEPVSRVADAAWETVHGDAVTVRVGKDARRAWTMTRLFPGFMRNQMKKRQRKRREGLAG